MGRHAAPKAKHALTDLSGSSEQLKTTSRGRHARPSNEKLGLRGRIGERIANSKTSHRIGAFAIAAVVGINGLNSINSEAETTSQANRDKVEQSASSKNVKRWKSLGKMSMNGSKPETSSTPETQNNSDFVYYSQYDPIRADRQYGAASYGKTIRSSGCLPVTLASVVSTMTGEEVKPGTIGDKYGPDYYHGGGTEHGMIYAVAEEYDLKVTKITDYDEGEKDVIEALQNGGYAVTSGGGENARTPYFAGGHFIAIREAVPANDTESGYRFKIANPVPSRELQSSSSEDITQTEWYNDTFSWDKGLRDAGMHSLYILEKNETPAQ